MAVKRKSHKPPQRRINLSERTKKTLLGSTGGLLVIVASYWAYYTFTTVPPPNLDKATAQEVVDYLGTDRGLSRLDYDNREKFLNDMRDRFFQGEKREQLGQAFEKMTPAQREVFVDASFELVKDRVLKQADEYRRLPPHRQTAFVDQIINRMEAERQSIAGIGLGAGGRAGGGAAGGGASNLAKAFESSMPTTTDGITKALVDRTTARQRAKAEPLFNAIVARNQARLEQAKQQ